MSRASQNAAKAIVWFFLVAGVIASTVFALGLVMAMGGPAFVWFDYIAFVLAGGAAPLALFLAAQAAWPWREDDEPYDIWSIARPVIFAFACYGFLVVYALFRGPLLSFN